MNFLELQNAVLTDRFDETKRADAKTWLNHRYGRIWSSEAWSFKLAIANLAVTQGSQSVTFPAFQRIIALRDGTITTGNVDLDYFLPQDFHAYATSTQNIPSGFTVVGSSIYLDRPASSDRTLVVVGETKFVALSADGDTPLLPEEFHLTLVHGARSEGLREENDPTWQGAEEDYRAGILDMRMGYLVGVRMGGNAYPAWP